MELCPKRTVTFHLTVFWNLTNCSRIILAVTGGHNPVPMHCKYLETGCAVLRIWGSWPVIVKLFITRGCLFKNYGKDTSFHEFLPTHKVEAFVSLYLASKMQVFLSQSMFANPNQTDSRFIDVMSYICT